MDLIVLHKCLQLFFVHLLCVLSVCFHFAAAITWPLLLLVKVWLADSDCSPFPLLPEDLHV